MTRHASQTPSDRLAAVGQWYQLLAAVTDFTLRQLDAAKSELPPSELAYCAKTVRYIDLMKNQQLSLKEAAYNVGIEDLAYMSRLFKKQPA